MEKHVYFVRHGESSLNADLNRLSGTVDVPMTDAGRELCRALTRFFESPVEAVFSSRLIRSQETASLIFPNGPVPQLRDELLEFDYGHFDGTAVEQLASDHPVAIHWREAPGDMTFPGGQNIREYATAARNGMCQLIRTAPARRIACVGHKTMGRLFVAQVIGLDLNAFRGIPMDNCSITEFKWTEEHGIVLHSLNLTPEHLLL